MNVLIVGNEKQSLSQLRALFERNGFIVEEAGQGAEALTKARRCPPQLVVSDLFMPVMDGYTLLRHWKADKRLKTIPFVACAGSHTEPKQERLALDLGADAFIVRSVKPDEFMARVREVLAKKPCDGDAVVTVLESQRKAETALRENEERLRLALSAANQGLYDVNLQTGKIIVTPEYARMLGYDPEEFHETKDLWVQRLHPDDREQALRIYQEFIAGRGDQFRAEFRQRTKSGDWKWILSLGKTVLRDARGTPIRMLGTHSDITERKQTEAALRASEAKYRVLVDNADEAIYVAQDGWIKFANPTCEVITGYTQEELMSRPFVEFVHPEDRDGVMARHAAWMSGVECPLPAVRRIITRSGETRWVEYSATLIEWGGRRASLNFISDITERRRTEEALRRSEDRLRTLVEMAPEAIFIETNRRFAYVNPAALRLFGATRPEELLGQPVIDRYHPDFHAELRERIRMLNEGGSPIPSLDGVCLMMDGSPRHVSVCAVPFDFQNEHGTLVFTRDITERTRVETELERNHEQYRRAIVAANAIPYQTDFTTRKYTFIGEGIHALTGYSASEIYPSLWKEMILETVFMGDAAGLTAAEASRRAIAGELKNWCADYRIRARDGKIRWISDASVPILNAEGKYVGSLGILQEITERKRAEEDLRIERALLRTLVDHLPVAVYVKDTAGRKTLVNRMDVRNLGVASEAELLGKTDFDILPREQAERFRQDELHVMQTGEPMLNRDEFITRPDGTAAWVLTSKVPLHDATGRVTGLVGIGMEITEQRKAMEQLHKLARAVEQSPTSIVIADRDGNIEFVNPKFTRVTGYTAEEVLGRNPRILKSGETPVEEYKGLWETLSAGREWHGEFHNKRKDGTLFWESASISPVRDAAGKITHFIAVKEDITEQKMTQAKLLRAQRVESIGSLASGIAHDLNNILTPIIMCAPMLQWDNSPENRRDLAQTIESSAQRAAAVVKQLLSFARGKDARKQPVQMRHMVRDMAKLARETFPRSIQIEDECPPNLWPVLADATQLHQVILNLCVNARDAMPAGGKLILRARNVTLDDHYVSMYKEATPGPFVLFQVEDTGVGIPDEMRDRIFESFFTTKGEGEGSGLGLTTVLGIVRDHKGFMTFTTTLGKGTTFDVYLPADPTATPEVEKVKTGEAIPQGHGELILVVDDESAICDTTQRTLERRGYSVLQAHNGIEALAQFSNHQGKVKAVVTDFMMPLMDGVTLCRTLRALSPETPLIVSSGGLFGKPGGDAMRAFKELKIGHILNKPHTAEVLLQALDEELRPPRSAAVAKGEAGRLGETTPPEKSVS